MDNPSPNTSCTITNKVRESYTTECLHQFSVPSEATPAQPRSSPKGHTAELNLEKKTGRFTLYFQKGRFVWQPGRGCHDTPRGGVMTPPRGDPAETVMTPRACRKSTVFTGMMWPAAGVMTPPAWGCQIHAGGVFWHPPRGCHDTPRAGVMTGGRPCQTLVLTPAALQKDDDLTLGALPPRFTQKAMTKVANNGVCKRIGTRNDRPEDTLNQHWDARANSDPIWKSKPCTCKVESRICTFTCLKWLDLHCKTKRKCHDTYLLVPHGKVFRPEQRWAKYENKMNMKWKMKSNMKSQSKSK